MWHLAATGPECHHEPSQHLLWAKRFVRVESSKVHIELSIRKTSRHIVRPLHGEGRLADAASTRHDRDHHRRCRIVHAEHVVQGCQFTTTPGESVHLRWQLGRDVVGG
jgi:hypothetical protein